MKIEGSKIDLKINNFNTEIESMKRNNFMNVSTTLWGKKLILFHRGDLNLRVQRIVLRASWI